MVTVEDVSKALESSQTVTEEQLEDWILDSDATQHDKFFTSETNSQKAVETISKIIVTRFLNCSDTNVVPVRRKTKFLLLLNNLALRPSMRSSIFEAIKDLDSIFEDSMKVEGKMPFDSELGRMSEHVLVLMMRVLNYDFKAEQVLEFAEQSTQFAVQLLLAILLKEPPYEFELRCNCIADLLGFTQPQAFFSASSDAITFHECSGFTDKIDFTLDLMLRLNSVQVLNDVLTAQMLEHDDIRPLEHRAVTQTMQCIMNIFQFCSKGSQQWRQHVLLSTTFVDGATLVFIHGHVKALEHAFRKTDGPVSISPDVLRGLSLAFKFGAFATFHLGHHAYSLRPLCGFVHHILRLPISKCKGTCVERALPTVFANLFHFMSNMEVLAGDDATVGVLDDLPPGLQSAEIRDSLAHLIHKEVAGLGGDALETWKRRFMSVEAGTLVSHDGVTFQEFLKLFESGEAPSKNIEAPKAGLENLKSMAQQTQSTTERKKAQKMEVSKAGLVVETVLKAAAPRAVDGGRFACALNGHTMKVPMLSPHGHNFERETIEQWIRQQGPVCPITGKPLKMEDLQLNKQLQQEIMQQMIRETMKEPMSAGGDDDLYKF